VCWQLVKIGGFDCDIIVVAFETSKIIRTLVNGVEMTLEQKWNLSLGKVQRKEGDDHFNQMMKLRSLTDWINARNGRVEKRELWTVMDFDLSEPLEQGFRRTRN
jgi:hypothetical protein